MYSPILLSLVLIFSHVSSYSLIEAPKPLYNVTRAISRRPTFTEYSRQREELITRQQARGLGHDLQLSEAELQANDVIMSYKTDELNEGFENPFLFVPSRNMFMMLDKIRESKLFKVLQKMPKGGILHAHDTALCSTEFVVSLTARDNLWQCGELGGDLPQFLFSATIPATVGGCTWERVSSIRMRMGDSNYDREVRKLFTMYTGDPTHRFEDINFAWSRFMNIFGALDKIVTYAPVWKDYYYQALKEMYDDGVLYLEFRGTLPPVYNLDGSVLTPVEIVQTYVDTLAQFKTDYPDFIGSKFVYAPVRAVDDQIFNSYLDTMLQLHERFPDFVVGFDLVGQEDKGRPLTEFIERLLNFPDTIKFFFHAGETNWNGLSTDENMIDAILLGTTRIGHGYALVKNPSLLELIREKDICIEVNPVSNQVRLNYICLSSL
jgi:adenosine deaminase CECR1